MCQMSELFSFLLLEMDVNVQIKKFSRIGVSFFSLKCLFDLIIRNFMYLL